MNAPKRPSDFMFQIAAHNDLFSLEKEKSSINLEEMILANMRQKMADHLVRAHVTRTVKGYSVEHRMEVCVLTYDELRRLIREEATRLAFRPYDLDLGK